MSQLQCSSCTKEIVGVGIVMADELSDEAPEGFITYRGEVHGRDTTYFLLHPVCFTAIFDELIRQQQEAAMFVAVAVAGNIREALGV